MKAKVREAKPLFIKEKTVQKIMQQSSYNPLMIFNKTKNISQVLLITNRIRRIRSCSFVIIFCFLILLNTEIGKGKKVL